MKKSIVTLNIVLSFFCANAQTDSTWVDSAFLKKFDYLTESQGIYSTDLLDRYIFRPEGLSSVITEKCTLLVSKKGKSRLFTIEGFSTKTIGGFGQLICQTYLNKNFEPLHKKYIVWQAK